MTKRYTLIRKSTGNTAGQAATRAEARGKNRKTGYGLWIYDNLLGDYVR